MTDIGDEDDLFARRGLPMARLRIGKMANVER